MFSNEIIDGYSKAQNATSQYAHRANLETQIETFEGNELFRKLSWFVDYIAC